MPWLCSHRLRDLRLADRQVPQHHRTLDLLADLRLLVLHEMLPKLDFKLDHFKLLFSFFPLRELFLKCWFLAYDHLLLVGAPSTILLEPFLQNQELLRQGELPPADLVCVGCRTELCVAALRR